MFKVLLRLRKSIFKKFGLKVVPIENNSLKYLFPEATDFEINLVCRAAKFSMTGHDRIFSLLRAIQHVNNNNLEGDFVECGVWKGGNLILFKKMIEKLKIVNKKIYGFDTFEGMSEPTDDDADADGFLGGFKAKYLMRNQKKDINIENMYSYVPIDLVEKNFQNNTEDTNNLVLVKGKVEDTLKISSNIPEKISILRLDTDWYESTKIELEILYPRLVKNGVLIIDDYGEWSGSRKATDEYFKDKKISMFKIDRAARLIFKPSA
jgi:O-methyltransferase